jgi:hypothetical protein
MEALMLIPQNLPQADLQVAMMEGPVYPGSVLKAQVSLSPRDSFHVSRGQVELVRREILSYEELRLSGPVAGPRLGRRGSWTLRRLGPQVVQRQAFLSDTEISGGVPYQDEVALIIPDDASPTAKGKITEITWELRASVAVARPGVLASGPSALLGLNDSMIESRSLEVVVFAPPGQEPSAAPAPWSTLNTAQASFNQCALSLFLPTLQVKNGADLSGILRAQVRRPLHPREVRVELVRWERSGTKQKETTDIRVVLAADSVLAIDDAPEWPFTLPVPERLLPSLSTGNSFVGWHVRGVLDRRVWSDFIVGQPIQVYTGP